MEEIDGIYNYWQKHFDERVQNLCSDLKIVSRKGFISDEQKVPTASFLSGIDFPIWFDNDNLNNFSNDKKRIMVIGIDPLRNERSFNEVGANKYEDVIIGTPYALHNLNVRNGRTKNYWSFIEGLAIKHFVYLTDIYKVFFYTDSSKVERSYVYYRNSNRIEMHIELLEREIELVKPDLIITLGAETYRNLFPGRKAPKLSATVENNISLRSNFPVLPMVHLSGSTREKIILQFIEENNVELNEAENYGQHYCRIVENYLNSKRRSTCS
jgi:hypothetical protein